jgi:ribosome recycling factor
MFKAIFDNIKTGMEKAVEHTKNELKKVRTGRANPDMFNSIFVDYYGSKTPLNQVSTISAPEARMISITPYEKQIIPIIEKAIIESNMGYSPSNNGTSVLIPIPALSQERRNEMIKYSHQIIEDGKISIRSVRRDGIHQLHIYGKDEKISEDLIKDNESIIQSETDKFTSILDELQSEKESEVLEI